MASLVKDQTNPISNKRCIHVYTHPNWKLYTFTWVFTLQEKETPVPSNAGIEILGMFKLYKLGSKTNLKKKSKKFKGSLWFKVMNFPIYSIQREVIKKMKL